MFWSFLERAIAYALVIAALFSPLTKDRSLQVTFMNFEEEDVYLCWMSAYAREYEVISGSRDNCYIVTEGVLLNTFTGHRFLALPINMTSNIKKQFFVIDQAIQYNISFTNQSNQLSNYSDFSFAYFWNHSMLRYRHEVVVLFAIIFITGDLLFKRPKPESKFTQSNAVQLGIPRQYLKAFATLMMLINHASYLFLADYPAWMRLGALPADLGGSMHLYCWLTGYNHSSHSRTQVWGILIAFLLLEQYCRLPPPFAYESLMTIVVARILFSQPKFNYFLQNCSIIFHGLLIAILLLSEPFLNADGLRILQISGLLYAIAGKLFILPIDTWKQFIWLFAGSLRILFISWKSTLSEVDPSSSPQIAITALCLGWFVFHIILLGYPMKKPYWNPTVYSPIMILSRYSLEIYVIHLFLAYYYHLSVHHIK